LEFLSVYSLYEENLRLFALAKCRDEGKRNLRTLALAMALIFLFLTLFLFFGMSQGLSYSLDRFLLLRSYPAFFPLGDSRSFVLVILIALSVSLPAALLPLLKVSDKEIQKELEGED
jgi:ABC-type antimicrobial peptide transport system permease subunit